MQEHITEKQIRELDFIRVVCTLGIFTFHFNVDRSTFFGVVGGGGAYTGGIFVAMFFMLSGFLLRLTVNRISMKYFLDRFRRIFLPFWIAFFTFYLQRVFYVGSFFWDYSLKKATLLQSIVGMDGWLAIHGIKNYYLVGEWFLGAIIILYTIYPLLLCIIKHSQLLFAAMLCLCYATMILIYEKNPEFFVVGPEYNLLTLNYSRSHKRFQNLQTLR